MRVRLWLSAPNAPLIHLLITPSPAGGLLLSCARPSSSSSFTSTAAAAAAVAAAAPSSSWRRIPAWRLWAALVGLRLIRTQLFAASGHRSSFSTLHFSAAFTVRSLYAIPVPKLLIPMPTEKAWLPSRHESVFPGSAVQGFDEFGFVTQGVLLASVTWSADILSALALPFIISAAAGTGGAKTTAAAAAAEDSVVARRRVLWASALMLSAPVATAAFAAAALRRDLHVWELFAPKLCFDVAGLLVAAIAAGLSRLVGGSSF